MAMDGLPFLPGNTYRDPTRTQYHRSQTLGFTNGFSMHKRPTVGIGGTRIECNQLSEKELDDLASYNPVLTYGQAKAAAPPPFVPSFVALDKKILRYHALYKGSVHDAGSGEERKVDILYYLVDDTIAVVEKPEENGGLFKGKLLNRQRMPKDDVGGLYSWKDLNVNQEIVMYGRVFEICDCDAWSREWLTSEGIIVNPSPSNGLEAGGNDPMAGGRDSASEFRSSGGKQAEIDKLKKFLELDRKVLRFYAIWDDRDEMFGDARRFIIHYYLVNDTVEVREVHTPNDGRDPFPVLISRQRIPKDRYDVDPSFPAVILELSDKEIKEYFSPKDFWIGKTPLIYHRKFFIYDCDNYTKAYYWKHFGITDFTPAEYDLNGRRINRNLIPQLEEDDDLTLEAEKSMHSCRTLLMQPPQRQDFSALPEYQGLVLRFEAILDSPKPEDKGRRFILSFQLDSDMISIYEPHVKNSGIIGGKFLEKTRVAKPGSNSSKPKFYGPQDFYVGAIVDVFRHRFIITNADEFVLKFMETHSDAFPEEQIQNLRETIRSHPSSTLREYAQRSGYVRSKRQTGQDELDKVVEQVKAQLKRIAITGNTRKDQVFLGVEMNRAGYIDKANIRDMCIRQQLPCDDEIVDGLAKRIGKNPERISLEELRQFLEE